MEWTSEDVANFLEFLGRAADSNYPTEVPMIVLTLFGDGSGEISVKKPDPGHSLTDEESTLWHRKFHNYPEAAEVLLNMPADTAPTEVNKDLG